MILVFVACLVGDFPRINYAGLSHQIICVAALAVMLLGSRLAAYDASHGDRQNKPLIYYSTINLRLFKFQLHFFLFK